MPKLAINRLENIQIPLPPLSQQESIVKHLDQLHTSISTLKAQYQAQLQQYDNLWSSILDQAFKGELVKE
jgi:restriction endonuclease S subunit